MPRVPERPPAADGGSLNTAADTLPPAIDQRRRQLLSAGASLLLLVSPLGRAASRPPSIVAVRLWPSTDYTRVTLEHDAPLKFTHFTVKNPERLVVDLEGVEFNAVLDELPRKLTTDDPYIKLVRAGRFKPGVVRLVLELKTEVKPQVFTLQPVGNYGHRLVLDIYPFEQPDPLLQLLQEHERRKAADAGMAPVDEPIPGRPDPTAKANAAAKGEGADLQGGAGKGTDPRRKPVVARLVTITLDPGHGGEDPGAVGRAGSYEKNVTLSVARRLKRKIDAEPNLRAVLTRDGDYYVPLQARVQKARRVQSDLFVSIHADAWIKPDARGSSVFVLSESGATSTAARWLAKKENDADLIGGVNMNVKDPHLARTLLDLSLTGTINDSLKLGRAVLGELGQINRLHKPRVEQAGFAVLKAPDIPSILVETAFISNPEEEKRLNDEAYQEQMADAILAGIRKYLEKNPPPPKARLAGLT